MKLRNQKPSETNYPPFDKYHKLKALTLGVGAAFLFGCSSNEKEIRKAGVVKTNPKLPEVEKPKEVVKDSDGDGIKDNFDQCIMKPEDKDGFEDDDGCPDPDNDKDGIPDKKDKCPNKPETVNGRNDEDGCPDVKRHFRLEGLVGRKVRAPKPFGKA